MDTIEKPARTRFWVRPTLWLAPRLAALGVRIGVVRLQVAADMCHWLALRVATKEAAE